MPQERKTQWYWVAATCKAVHKSEPRRRRYLWERTIFLVQAANDHECREKAMIQAEQKQHSYVSATGSSVRWVFQEIEELQPLHSEEFTDGTEVYWKFFERVDKG